MKNTVWTALISRLVQAVVVFVAGALLRRSLIDQQLFDLLMSEGVQQLTGLVLTGLGVLWIARHQIYAWLWGRFALAAPPDTPPADVAAAVKALPLGDKLKLALKGGGDQGHTAGGDDATQ